MAAVYRGELCGGAGDGQPVFIDFTAAWCLSCQVNERAVLKSEDVEKALVKNHVQLLKADWTQYDPVITRELAAVGRSGVPTYVIYPPGKVSNPDVLPELLTKGAVLTAIEKDARADGAAGSDSEVVGLRESSKGPSMAGVVKTMRRAIRGRRCGMRRGHGVRAEAL